MGALLATLNGECIALMPLNLPSQRAQAGLENASAAAAISPQQARQHRPQTPPSPAPPPPMPPPEYPVLPRDLQPDLDHLQHSVRINLTPGNSAADCGGADSSGSAKHSVNYLPARYLAEPLEQSMQPTGMQPQQPREAASHQIRWASPQQPSETGWTADTNTSSASPEQRQQFQEQLYPAAAETTGLAALQQVRAAQAVPRHLHRGAPSLPHHRLSLPLAVHTALIKCALCAPRHQSAYAAVLSPVECASIEQSHAASAKHIPLCLSCYMCLMQSNLDRCSPI